jgi:hypothetical protein
MIQEEQKPKYFIANFGEKYSSTYPVDKGCYRVPTIYDDTKMISVGDIMLLCCWAGHKGLLNGDAWGLGKVTKKERDEKEQDENYYINYKWMQFTPAISNDTIYTCLKPEGKEGKFKMGPRYSSCWLFEIKATTFLCITSSW